MEEGEKGEKKEKGNGREERGNATCHHRRQSRQKTCALSHSPDVYVCILSFCFFLLLCVDFTGCQDASFP